MCLRVSGPEVLKLLGAIGIIEIGNAEAAEDVPWRITLGDLSQRRFFDIG